MRTALLAVRLGLAARSNANVKTRQPLPEIRLYIHETFLQDLDNNIVQIIKDELNVKSVKLLNEDSELKSKFQPIAKEIAMIAGADTQNVIKAVKDGEYQLSEVFGETLVTIGEHSFGKEAFKVVYEPKEGFVVENDETLVVALNTKVSDELVEEGLANELTRHFQELRKSAGLEISDRIEASVQTKDTKLLSAFETHQPAIASEILARSLELTGAITENRTNLTIDGKVVTLGLRKVAN
jgi:isoleucyl-tRNA synthetase